jgi:glyoxylase-like metal-dependent hydrolase (beta-lactamase superfamily II)
MNPYSVDAFKKEIDQGKSLFLLDIRGLEDFKKGHIEAKNLTTHNLPYADWPTLEKTQIEALLPKDQEIVVVCYRGRTSAIATADLEKLGYRANSLQGGMQAWDSYYSETPILVSPELSIYQITRVAKGCLSYLMTSGKEGVLIDPTRHLQTYLNLIEKLGVRLKAIIDSHAHADHLSGGKELSKKLEVPYFLHPYDAIHPKDLLPATFSYNILSKEPILIGKNKLEILHVPGHTLGNSAFLLNNHYFFSGDSLFIDSIARPDLGERTKEWAALHYHSLRALWHLPDEVTVLPGHFYQQSTTKTIGELKIFNEGFIQSQNSLEEFTDYILKHLPEHPAEYPEIKRGNLGLISVTEEEANRLEQGKNACAIT